VEKPGIAKLILTDFPCTAYVARKFWLHRGFSGCVTSL